MPTLPSHLTHISSSISQLTGLQRLTVRGANMLPELPDVFGAFSKLRELKLIGTSMVSNPESWFCNEQ
jgi:hypothetical protein